MVKAPTHEDSVDKEFYAPRVEFQSSFLDGSYRFVRKEPGKYVVEISTRRSAMGDPQWDDAGAIIIKQSGRIDLRTNDEYEGYFMEALAAYAVHHLGSDL